MLLIASWTSFSQDTRSVKTETLKLIKKDLDKCDSLKVAYGLKSAALDTLVLTNFKLFKELDEQRKIRMDLQDKLNIRETELLRAVKKSKSNWLVPALFGVIGGTVLGVSL